MSVESFPISVIDIKSRKLVFDVNSSDTIEEIKNKIRDRNGIPLVEQNLIWAGKKLENNLTIQDYQIKKESKIWLVLKAISG